MKTPYTAEAYALLSPTFDTARGKWLIPNPQVERCQFIFDTEAQARQCHTVELRHLRDREKWEAENAAAQAKAAADRAAYLSSFRGFLPGDPMRAGRILQTLEIRRNYKGNILTRKQIVENLVAEGRTLTDDGLQNAEGAFLTIGKTERAYAAHLIALRLTPPVRRWRH